MSASNESFWNLENSFSSNAAIACYYPLSINLFCFRTAVY